ncbi:DUF1049 domain-containing protein [Actinospica sp. MGRD01-02]|uniref:DUF1049 domain-containing protein n=1 Tax=Actinospica acidithermotolerans TaxID=2828514 RepID=A0A941EA52_9ACTN|nr:lipopolysaccharide assembly protein LapA domain-containing protein [Actinospica acidithermotolerans]MBR7826657.1 DUF1049 domain-containing protein [Actinospica acidithermotolerans]
MSEKTDVKGAAPIPAQVKGTRLGGTWLMLALGAAVLVLLLVFILMNGQSVQVHFYGAHFNAPLGVALLLAAALGVLLVVVPGGGRILQLKRAARRLHQDREHLAFRLREGQEEAVAPGDGPAPASGRQAGAPVTTAPGAPDPTAAAPTAPPQQPETRPS